MARTQEQEQDALPGIPGPAKRKIIRRIEDKCLARDELAGKRTAISDEIAELSAKIQADIVAEGLTVYTYKDANSVLQDVINEMTLKKKKSKSNPKPKKGDDE